MVLDWVSEQYATRTDHLEVLLGSQERWAQRFARRMADAGLVELRRVLVDQAAWLWVTRRGQRLARTDYRAWRFRPGALWHIAAVNDVRLHVQARSPESVWVCERQLARDLKINEHLPDALVMTDGQCHAVEVELTLKARGRTEAIVDELSGRYDAVVYFAPPAIQRSLDRLGGQDRWPKLVVRSLPSLEPPGTRS